MTGLQRLVVAAALAAFVQAGPALAGYKLMAKGQEAIIAKSTLLVTPDTDWNRLGSRIGRYAESWTLDGLSLNDVTFYAGIGEGETLFREVNKKESPLPRFSATMLPTDIAQIFEGSYRIANKTSLFSIDSIEPATFAGAQGVRFTYSFTVQGEEVRRHGEATGAIISGRLYLITYEGPALHYFARDIDRFRAIVAQARVTTATARR